MGYNTYGNKMSLHVANVYTERRDTEDEISNLKARLAEAELKLEGINKQIAEQTPMKADKLEKEIADEKEELAILRKQVDNKVGYIYKLMQEAVRDKARGGHGMVRYHIRLDGQYYRYNISGDMFSESGYVGRWDGFTLDRKAEKSGAIITFPAFLDLKEFRMTV